MTIRRSILIGAALLLGAAAPAVAADLNTYGGSLKDDIPDMESSARMYLRGDIGYSWTREVEMTENGVALSNDELDNTWDFGGGIGWYLHPNFRADLTVEHRRSADASAVAYPYDPVAEMVFDFDVQSTFLLANFYYDFSARSDFNPYVGFGIGASWNTTGNGSVTDACGCVSGMDGARESNFAWALMAGVSKNIRDGFNVDLGYRYLNLGGAHTGNIIDNAGAEVPDTDPVIDTIAAHELRLGFRYDIY